MNGGFTMDRPLVRAGGDPALLGSLCIIVGTGLAGLYSASYGYAMSLGKPGSYFVMRQLVWLVPACAVFALGAFTPLELTQRFMGLIVIASLCMLVLPFLPLVGITKNGASRWFGFAGQMFQPSELFKPVLVLYLAHILSKKADRLADVVHGVFPPLIVAGAGVLIVLLQNDFSTALLLGLLAMTMFWVADVPVVFFAAMASIGLPLVVLSVLTSGYRLNRILGFLAPGYDPSTLSYQITSSIRAIGSGGVWGKGIGLGTLKLGSIPEVQSDFVFAAWAEETGLVGVLGFAAIWAFFLWRAFRASFMAPDSYRSHLAFGMACYLGFQALVNIMVASGAAPATGIPLPFFSSGGASLFSAALAAGCSVNVARRSAGGRERIDANG